MTVTTKNGLLIIVPCELTSENLTAYYNRIQNLLEKKPETIKLDCSDLYHITSSHINVLWETRSLCNKAGITIILTSVSFRLESVLKVLDLLELFIIEKPGDKKAITGKIPKEPDYDIKEFQLEFKADSGSIKNALNKFHLFLKDMKLTRTFAIELETVFYEVATNILLHGHIENNKSIRFTASPTSEKISICFVDPGLPFDPTSRMTSFEPNTVIRLMRKRGIGLMMIRKMVDDISYQRKQDGYNVLILEKKWR